MEGEAGVWRERQECGGRGRSVEGEAEVWRERQECGGKDRSVEGGVWRGEAGVWRERQEVEGGVWREREECGGRGRSVEGEASVWRGRGRVYTLILIPILICWNVNLLFESCLASLQS